MSKTIRVTTSSGDTRVKVSNEAELDRVLQRNNATCFVDGEQIQIYGFDSLENDGTYTYGPAPAALAQQKKSPRKPYRIRSAGVNSNPSRLEQVDSTAGEGATDSGAGSSPPAARDSPNATTAAAVKEGDQVISNFFAVKRKRGRPKKTMMESPEETEQATASALEAHRPHGRPRKEQKLPFSIGQTQEDSPPATAIKDDAPQAKRRRTNWSKGDNRVKLEAALSKWKEEGRGTFDKNGEALSLRQFADIEGIPVRTFRNYTSGKRDIGACCGRKSVFSKDASSALVGHIVRHNERSSPKSLAEVIDIGRELHPELTRTQVSKAFQRTIWSNNADLLNPDSVVMPPCRPRSGSSRDRKNI
jgi:hypothetical protein